MHYILDFLATFTAWGGDLFLHAKAQVLAWKKMINFFRRNLGPVQMCRNDWVNEDVDWMSIKSAM